MRLDLWRLHCQRGATIGALFVDGLFECFTLEDPPREPKVPGETRIPAGRYQVELRRDGGMHVAYTERFPDIHQGMLWIRGVPDFEWVYLHVGNVVADTEGCPLVGIGALADQVTSSVAAYRRFYPKVVDAAAAGDLQLVVHDPIELEERMLEDWA